MTERLERFALKSPKTHLLPKFCDSNRQRTFLTNIKTTVSTNIMAPFGKLYTYPVSQLLKLSSNNPFNLRLSKLTSVVFSRATPAHLPFLQWPRPTTSNSRLSRPSQSRASLPNTSSLTSSERSQLSSALMDTPSTRPLPLPSTVRGINCSLRLDHNQYLTPCYDEKNVIQLSLS